MRKAVAVLALAVLVLAGLPGVATATHSPGGGPKFDFVRGSGKYVEEYDFDGDGKIDTVAYETHFTISAKSGPSGENPEGRWSIDSRPFEQDRVFGDVTCLRVEGNRAIVGGRYDDRSSTLGHDSEGVLFEFVDNGPGTDDAAGGFVSYVSEEALQSCELGYSVPFQQGNFIVHDATP